MCFPLYPPRSLSLSQPKYFLRMQLKKVKKVRIFLLVKTFQAKHSPQTRSHPHPPLSFSSNLSSRASGKFVFHPRGLGYSLRSRFLRR